MARDARFDGLFFVGVTSTHIYCRPICPAKTPKEAHCRFFMTTPEAEHAGFRPCLRCRPELAPGCAPIDDAGRIARLMVQRLEEGTLDDEAGLDAIADQFELSSRQVRRIVRSQLGVPPIQLLLTRRLLLAKHLLTETGLPITDIAFASGFSSLRRFNDAFVTRYGLAPTALRRTAVHGTDPRTGAGTSTLRLAYRPPYDWTGMLAFLRDRAMPGVEWVTADSYARTVRLGNSTGWIRVMRSQTRDEILLEFTHSLTPALPALLSRVRALFDLDARPDVIGRHLARDRRLATAVRDTPGVRVPGAFNGFEIGMRAILGQQVTVKAATTVAGRIAGALGAPFATPFPVLNRLAPTPTDVAAARVSDLAKHGVIETRCAAVIALAGMEVSGDLSLDREVHQRPETVIARLTTIPGVGRWTAEYVAMRALRWPDAFPPGDVALRGGLGGVTAKEAEAISQAWRPWRSYAVMLIWRMATRTPASRGGKAAVA